MSRLVALTFGLFALAASAEDVSFKDAAREMLAKNPKIAQVQLQTDASRHRLGAVKSGYWPQLELSQSWATSDNPVFAFTALLNQQRISPPDFAVDAINHPDPATDVSTQLQLNWLILDFGGRRSRVESAQSGHQISTLQEESTRLALLRELVRRYYAVSLAARRSVVADEALESADSRLGQARDRVSHGLVVRSDELAAEVFRASRLQEKIEAENQHRFAVAALGEILGGHDDQLLSTAELSERSFPHEPLSFWLEEMKQKKPDLQIAREASNVAHSQVREARSHFLPAIQGWSNVQWHGESFDYAGGTWGVGVELRWNLFRGLADSEQLAGSMALERSWQEKQREIDDALQLQLKQAYFQFESAEKKLAVSSAMVAQADESRRTYADRYDAGMVSIQDSLQAETAYNESRLKHDQNLYDLYVAFADLLGAAGKGDDIEEIEVER